MMSLVDLLNSFWGYMLKTVIYILNRVLFKSIGSTSYEMWYNKKLIFFLI